MENNTIEELFANNDMHIEWNKYNYDITCNNTPYNNKYFIDMYIGEGGNNYNLYKGHFSSQPDNFYFSQSPSSYPIAHFTDINLVIDKIRELSTINIKKHS